MTFLLVLLGVHYLNYVIPSSGKPKMAKKPIKIQVDEETSEKLGYHTYERTAKLLGLTSETIRRYGEWGWLDRVYLGNQPLITQASIEQFQRPQGERPARSIKKRGRG